jgi:hypothetical protein
MTVYLLACAAGASAQSSEERAFLNINAGAQPQQRTLTTSSGFPLYDETATVTSTVPIQNGPVFEASGGYRVWRRLSIGGGFSSFSRSSTGALVASIPDLVFVGRPKTVTAEVADLAHTETGVHVRALWFVPLHEKVELALSAGPSIIWVGQDLAAVSVAPGTQSVTVTKQREHATGLGVNAGADLSYLFAPRFGVGLFVQYAGASVDLPTAAPLTVGGFQTGLGLRLRF